MQTHATGATNPELLKQAKTRNYRRPRCVAVTHAGRQCLNQSYLNRNICSTHINAEKSQIHVKVG